MNGLNLLPWRFRRKLIARTRVRQWSIVAISAAALVLAAAGFEYARIVRKEQTLSRLEARCQSLTKMRAESAAIQTRIAEAQKLESLLSRVENQELPFKSLGMASRMAAASNGRLQLTGLGVSRTTEAVPVADKPGVTESEERVALLLNGRAASNLAVADLVLRLRETAVFDAVTLKSGGTSTLSDATPGSPFQVECVQRTKGL